MSRYDRPQTSEDLSPDAIQREVERILASDKFARSKRLRSLLRFTVAQTLQGNAETLKEYVIGTEVLKKPDTYDPRSDSLVRVLASRLRLKLREYYRNGGMEDPLVIGFPKGRYVPVFQKREHLQTESEQKLRARNSHSAGRLMGAKLEEAALREAVRHLSEAAQADPSWPMPHAGLARMYALQAFFGYRRPREAWPLVKASAEAALQLDEMSAEGHLCLGMAQGLYEWRWKEAEAHFSKAIERDFYAGTGQLWRALAFLIPKSRVPEALNEIAALRELSPVPLMNTAECLALYFSGEHEKVLERAGNSPAQHGAGALPGWLRGCALASLGRVEESIQQFETLRQSAPQESRILSSLAYSYCMAGQQEKAQEIMQTLRARQDQGNWVPYCDFALIQLGLGNRSEALTLLQEALREKEPWLSFLNVDPRFSSLRAQPKFSSIVRRAILNDEEALLVEAAGD